MNEKYPRPEYFDDFVPKITFWKIMGWLIMVLLAAFGGLVGMSTTMDAAMGTEIDEVKEKVGLVDRLDERTINMQKSLDRIEKKLP